MKTYSGFEVLEIMKDHWVKQFGAINQQFIYKLIRGCVHSLHVDKVYMEEESRPASVGVNFFFKNSFVVYEYPIVASDYVKIDTAKGIRYGQVSETGVLALIGEKYLKLKGSDTAFNMKNVERIDKAEWDKVIREEMFKQHGRKLDEFHKGDKVKYTTSTGAVAHLEVLQQSPIGMVQFKNSMATLDACKLTPIEFMTRVKVVAPQTVCRDLDVVKVPYGTSPLGYIVEDVQAELNPYYGGNN